MDAQALVEAVIALEPDAQLREKSNIPAVCMPCVKLAEVMRRLRDDAVFAFDMFLSHTVIDWVAEGQFELVYQLYSTRHGHSLMVSTRVDRTEPVAPSVSHLWPVAGYQEREAYDLFGMQYDDHPDLRRVFLEDDWIGFPLRKDYQDEYMLERPQS